MKRGFTITELMVSIAIIGILTAIVYASLSGSREKARDSARVAEVTAISNALEQHYVRHRVYSPSSARGTFSSNSWNGNLTSALVPTFLPEMPTDSTSTYYLAISSNGQKYKVGVQLSDGTNHIINKGCTDPTLNTECE